MATQTARQASSRRPPWGSRTLLSDHEPPRFVPSRTTARRVLETVDPQRLARGLGWLSVGIGIAALLAPRAVARSVGRGRRSGIVAAVGARELASGFGILAKRDPTRWLWSRVAGDVMDLAFLGAGLRSRNPWRNRTAVATAAVVGVTALDVLTSIQFTRGRISNRPGRLGRYAIADVFVEESVTVNASPEEAYLFWRDPRNVQRVMRHVEAIHPIDDRHLHWVVRGPAGIRMEWDTEIFDDRPGEAIAWRSVEGASVSTAGSIRFQEAPNGRGTIVRESLHFSPPTGRLIPGLARLLGEIPERELREDLRRFKQLIETGEIPTTRGQPSGRRSMLARLTRAGRMS